MIDFVLDTSLSRQVSSFLIDRADLVVIGP